jgi:hypothetical protein
MTLNPLIERYLQPNYGGAYWSQVRDIGQYIVLFHAIRRLEATAEVRVYYHLALVYDFIFFCAQTCRLGLRSEGSTDSQ